MLDYSKGQVVMSKAGRDKGKILIILDTRDDYVYIADGKDRKLEKPKAKKKKHIQITNYIDSAVVQKIENAEKINNSDIRKAIEKYMTIMRG
ncbi:MAG TPA: RNA-binding protein [Clostridiales bacterium]|nr:MAG: hypothetical protein A2Y22_07565 [Clostridiales bacterium GWD2_32_59]HAN09241.1 RNA-binding protein [Clostridiales bacterium]